MFKVGDTIEHKYTKEKYRVVQYDNTFLAYQLECLGGSKYKIFLSETSVHSTYIKCVGINTPKYKSGDVLIYQGPAALTGIEIKIMSVNFDAETYTFCYLTNNSPLDYTRSWEGIHEDYCYPSNKKEEIVEPECTCDGYTLLHDGCQCEKRKKYDIDARWRELLGGKDET